MMGEDMEEEEAETWDMGPAAAPPDIEGLEFDDIVKVIVEWFFQNFENPANHTPYESAEGGYQYIWGGPYEANDELDMAFADQLVKFDETAQAKILKAAVDRIEVDGWEWAPNQSRMRPDPPATPWHCPVCGATHTAPKIFQGDRKYGPVSPDRDAAQSDASDQHELPWSDTAKFS